MRPVVAVACGVLGCAGGLEESSETATFDTSGSIALSISPATPCTGEAFEVVGAPAGAEVSWSVDGESASVSGVQVPEGASYRGERWRGAVDGGTAAVEVTIANCAPRIVSVEIDPSMGDALTTFSATVETYDAERDTLLVGYRWLVNGEQVQAGSNSRLLPGRHVRADEVTVEVVASDASESSEPASAGPVVVSNTPPIPASVLIQPRRPGPDDPLHCFFDRAASDPDGDTLSYTFSWTVDDAAFDGAQTEVLTGDSVPPSATFPGQTWTCAVAASDGIDIVGSTPVQVEIGESSGPDEPSEPAESSEVPVPIVIASTPSSAPFYDSEIFGSKQWLAFPMAARGSTVASIDFVVRGPDEGKEPIRVLIIEDDKKTPGTKVLAFADLHEKFVPKVKFEWVSATFEPPLTLADHDMVWVAFSSPPPSGDSDTGASNYELMFVEMSSPSLFAIAAIRSGGPSWLTDDGKPVMIAHQVWGY